MYKRKLPEVSEHTIHLLPIFVFPFEQSHRENLLIDLPHEDISFQKGSTEPIATYATNSGLNYHSCYVLFGVHLQEGLGVGGCKPNGMFSFQTEDYAKQNLGAVKQGILMLWGFFWTT